MTKLVHIKDIYFYHTTLDGHKDSDECSEAIGLIDQSGVDVNELLYNHEPHHNVIFESLSTWNWGSKGRNKSFDVKFPLLHWIECYDDFTQQHEHAVGVDDIANSAPVMNPTICAKVNRG